MVNSEDFVKRLEKLMHYYSLSAAAFADKIKVQRSSISHLLSGRNNPSLEFVLNVIKTFPEVNLYWLLNGKGTFPSVATEKTKTTPPTPRDTAIQNQDLPKDNSKDKTIEKIIIFYNDGSFKSYHE